MNEIYREIEELKDKRGYIQAGAPRFRGLFGRASLIVAWQLINYDPSIAEKTLLTLASLQGTKEDIKTGEEPGKILHEYYPEETPDDWWKEHKEQIGWLKRGKPVYMSIDSTPLFLIVFYIYLQKTKKYDLAKELQKNIESAIKWMIDYGDKDKDLFLEYEQTSPEGLFHQAWKDSNMHQLEMKPPIAIVEVQGYQYLALTVGSKMITNKNLAEKCIDRAKKLKTKFNKKFWSKKNNFYILALDKDKKPIDRITSNPGHLIFTGIVTKNKTDKIVKRLFQKDMLTKYGIRTYSSKEKEFETLSYHMGTVWPHDNWIIAQGLRQKGYNKEYNKIKKSILKAKKEIGFLPELYGVDTNNNIVKYRDACYPQAWASGSVLSFLLD